jgi:hypothetical protein
MVFNNEIQVFILLIQFIFLKEKIYLSTLLKKN